MKKREKGKEEEGEEGGREEEKGRGGEGEEKKRRNKSCSASLHVPKFHFLQYCKQQRGGRGSGKEE